MRLGIGVQTIHRLFMLEAVDKAAKNVVAVLRCTASKSFGKKPGLI